MHVTDQHYKRERRKTIDFEDEACWNEESRFFKLKQKSKTISELNGQIVDINSNYQLIIQTHHDEVMSSLEKTLEDLTR